MNEKKYILALDQGTTSSRSIIFDRLGSIRASVSQPFEQIYPQPGWVEHDPEEIWKTQHDTALHAIDQAGIEPDQIAAIGIANQRETTVVWERSSGRPIHNAIVWQCRRTTDMCEQLAAEGWTGELRQRTGLVLDAYFSATKVKWLLDHVPGAVERAARGQLCFGTIDSWILFNLTGMHATDYSNASRTMLYNIHELKWDEIILDRLELPLELLPEVRPTSGVFGVTKAFGSDIPVAAMCGDQQSALFGQAAFSPSDCKNTYGTGCFVLMNTGTKPAVSSHGLVTTIAWGLEDRVEYALEGSVFIGGAVIQWLRDELELIGSAGESEAIASQVKDTEGVYIVPAFVGLGAPYWEMRARGVITGLTRGSTKAHIVRAALESISYQSSDVIRAMESDTEKKIARLRVDGGAAANNLLMQHQADVLGIPVVRGQIVETTALGVAFLSGIGAGVWSGKDELSSIWTEDKVFNPQWDEQTRGSMLKGWASSIKKTINK